MTQETQTTQMENETQTTKSPAEKFLETYNLPVAGGKKRILKRISSMVDEANYNRFTEKAARILFQICKDPAIEFRGQSGLETVEPTRSIKVMAYRKSDKHLKLIAETVRVRGIDMFNALAINIREHHISLNSARLRELVISEIAQ